MEITLAITFIILSISIIFYDTIQIYLNNGKSVSTPEMKSF